MDFIGSNYCEEPAADRESSFRSKVPELLKPNESVVLAYKSRGGKGRDAVAFTTERLIKKDKRGVSGKDTKYSSIPYSAIQAWSLETSGGIFNFDAELRLFAKGVGRFSMDLTSDCNVFHLNKFLSKKILAGRTGAHAKAENLIENSSADEEEEEKPNFESTRFMDTFGNNSTQIDSGSAEEALKSAETPILLPSETVELAFKCGRDSFILTSMRFISIDVQGLTGGCVKYFSFTWPCIKAFAIETAGGYFDSDSELKLFLDIPDAYSTAPGTARRSRTRMDIDFRKGEVDLMSVQRYFADKVLGTDIDFDASAVADAAVEGVEFTDGTGFFSFGDDTTMIDPNEANDQYHSYPYPILQSCENVEMAFKGRRDIALFTNKRFILVDLQGWSGKKVEFFSVPWASVAAFGVQSAGSFMDSDSEMLIWPSFDDIYYPPEEEEDSPPPPPIPRHSEIELDFKKDKVDIMAIHQYLSERCLRRKSDDSPESGGTDENGIFVPTAGGNVENGIFVPNLCPPDIPVGPSIVDYSTPPNALDTILSSLTGDAYVMEPAEVEATLRNDEIHVLQDDEHVVLAYKAGRDSLVFSTKRIFIIDVKGMTGKKVRYISVPYQSIKNFAVESAGFWDSDSELSIQTTAYWNIDKIDQDLKNGKADIIAIQNLLAAQVFGSEDGSSSLDDPSSLTTSSDAGSMTNFLDYIKDDAKAIDAQYVNDKFHASPCILQSDESVDAAYSVRSDICILTTKRILIVDTKGHGTKVEYSSYPLKDCKAFAVATGGGMFSSPAVKLYVSDGAKQDVKQDFSSSNSDIWTVQKILANKIL